MVLNIALDFFHILPMMNIKGFNTYMWCIIVACVAVGGRHKTLLDADKSELLFIHSFILFARWKEIHFTNRECKTRAEL